SERNCGKGLVYHHQPSEILMRSQLRLAGRFSGSYTFQSLLGSILPVIISEVNNLTNQSFLGCTTHQTPFEKIVRLSGAWNVVIELLPVNYCPFLGRCR
ncbi:MAG: hypothetical protein JZD40_01140, partial [Sulfolobus sp.]|nr:hypothetical protein [Sulfolobus sp.]